MRLEGQPEGQSPARGMLVVDATHPILRRFAPVAALFNRQRSNDWLAFAIS